MPTIWLNGEWVDRESATVSVYDHGLLYGDGVFEGTRVYDGRAFRLEEHLDRFYDSAHAVLIDIPIGKAEFAAITDEAIRRSGLRDAYLRHVVTRGVGDLGIDPRKCAAPTLFLIVDEIRIFAPEVYDRGLRVVTAGTPIPHRESLPPRVKSLNYLVHILARMEGIQAGADEVLMLDSAGFVAEGSVQNLFVVKGGVLRTPPAFAGILKGVTRGVVLDLARTAGYDAREEPLNRYDVYTADEAFFTGTASEIIAIRELDGRVIGSGGAGPVTRDLTDRFRAMVRGGGS